MALTRSLLRGLGLDEEKISTIIEAHTETVDGLKAQTAEVQKKLDAANDALKAGNGWEEKYNALSTEFETFKNDTAAKQAKEAKEKAFRALLVKSGVSEKRIDSVMKVSNLDEIELDEKGAIKDEKTLAGNIKSEWSDFITKRETRSAGVETPPASTGGTMTRDQIMAIKDRAERHEAIRNNPQAFLQNGGK